MAFLELTGLSKTFDDGTVAVSEVKLDCDEGELVVLLGPSGCGKTTTLRMLAGLEEPTAGTIQIDGHSTLGSGPSERDVGFVFQFYALYPHFTVYENIAFPLQCSGNVQREEIAKRVGEMVARMGIGGLVDRRPSELSGGDQQRVALARALVRRPKLWLMDEPLGTLDADLRLELRELIRTQQLELGVTTIYVTHDQEEAMSLADRIVVMDAGSICQVGPPAEVYEQPGDLFVANFIGSPGMNFLQGGMLAAEDDLTFRTTDGDLTLSLPPRAVSRTGPATLGVRPEHVRADEGGFLCGRVALSEYLGSHRYVHLDTRIGRLVMRVRTGQRFHFDDLLQIDFDRQHVRLFAGPDGQLL